MTTTISQAAIDYLCSRYDVEADAIRIDADGASVIVNGRLPNTNEVGEFFAGYVADIEEEVRYLSDIENCFEF